ncbi:uncharacterized protein J3R85_009489 [Psidium guajava]|nr:uncharacterized protein J3R85_009489 [Psidium guajava]
MSDCKKLHHTNPNLPTTKALDSLTTNNGRYPSNAGRLLTTLLPFTVTLAGHQMLNHTDPLHDIDPNVLTTVAFDSSTINDGQ